MVVKLFVFHKKTAFLIHMNDRLAHPLGYIYGVGKANKKSDIST